METDVLLRWSFSWKINLDKILMLCREVWRMHHRCPALGGRWNCC